MEIMERYYLQRWHLELNKDALKKVKQKKTRRKERGMEAEENKIKLWGNLAPTIS